MVWKLVASFFASVYIDRLAPISARVAYVCQQQLVSRMKRAAVFRLTAAQLSRALLATALHMQQRRRQLHSEPPPPAPPPHLPSWRRNSSTGPWPPPQTLGDACKIEKVT